MVTVKPIRTEEDLDAALVRIEEIFFAEPGTPEGDELDVLGTLVEAYEDRHHPIGPPSIPGAIEFAIDQRMATESDLVSIFGSRAKLSKRWRASSTSRCRWRAPCTSAWAFPPKSCSKSRARTWTPPAPPRISPIPPKSAPYCH